MKSLFDRIRSSKQTDSTVNVIWDQETIAEGRMCNDRRGSGRSSGLI